MGYKNSYLKPKFEIDGTKVSTARIKFFKEYNKDKNDEFEKSHNEVNEEVVELIKISDKVDKYKDRTVDDHKNNQNDDNGKGKEDHYCNQNNDDDEVEEDQHKNNTLMGIKINKSLK